MTKTQTVLFSLLTAATLTAFSAQQFYQLEIGRQGSSAGFIQLDATDGSSSKILPPGIGAFANVHWFQGMPNYITPFVENCVTGDAAGQLGWQHCLIAGDAYDTYAMNGGLLVGGGGLYAYSAVRNHVIFGTTINSFTNKATSSEFYGPLQLDSSLTLTGSGAFHNTSSALSTFDHDVSILGTLTTATFAPATVSASTAINSNGAFTHSGGGAFIVSGVGATFNNGVTSNAELATADVLLRSSALSAPAGQISIGNNTATSATAGTNGAPPAAVAGYLQIYIGSTQYKIPYYAN
jgi:hypothetical protein